MHGILLFLAAVLATVLPFVFRRATWLRTACVVALGLLAGWHFAFLSAEHELLLERGIRHFGASPTTPLPDDFMVAVGAVEDLTRSERWFFLFVMVGLVVVALRPPKQSQENVDGP